MSGKKRETLDDYVRRTRKRITRWRLTWRVTYPGAIGETWYSYDDVRGKEPTEQQALAIARGQTPRGTLDHLRVRPLLGRGKRGPAYTVPMRLRGKS